MTAIYTGTTFHLDSRETEILDAYLHLNRDTICVKEYPAKYTFDYLFEFILRSFNLWIELKDKAYLKTIAELEICEPELADLRKFVNELNFVNKLNSTEVLTFLRKAGKELHISYKTLTEYSYFIPDYMFWSPELALENILQDWKKGGYGTTFMNDYFRDKCKRRKIRRWGLQSKDTPYNELKVCLLSFLINDPIKHHWVVKKGNYNINDVLKIVPVEHWSEVMVNHIQDFNFCGINNDYKDYVCNLSKITKFWDTYKSQSINPLFVGNELIKGGDVVSDNDLFDIYAGEYSRVPPSYTKDLNAYNIKEANKLICEWDNFNILSDSQQKATQNFLLQNINRVSSYIQKAAQTVYNTLVKAKKAKDYGKLLNKFVKSSSYYGEATTDNILYAQQLINTRMNNAKFKTVSDAMEFIVHQYVPILRNYKKSNTYNDFNNKSLMNSEVLSVIGVAEYLPEESKSHYLSYVNGHINRPVLNSVTGGSAPVATVAPNVITKYIMVGGAPNDTYIDDRNKNNSTERFIEELVNFQKNFNKTYLMNWRDIVNKLGNINEHDVINQPRNDEILRKLKKNLVTSNKTIYYLSGIYKPRNINYEYVVSLGDMIKTIIESKNQAFQSVLTGFKNIYDLCKGCPNKLKEIHTRYMKSNRNLGDYIHSSLNKIKIEGDLTIEEITKYHDIFNRLYKICNDSRTQIYSPGQSNSANMLKKYLDTHKDKNKIINDYFSNIETELKQQLTSLTINNTKSELIEEFQTLVKMRLNINEEMRKGYVWLNTNLESMLVSNRLHQLKESTLTIDVLQRIERAYIDFNNYSKELEMEKIAGKFKKYSEDPNKFRSYFKIARIAKKTIENVDLLGYIERLYKELGICSPDFNWGMFKERLTVFLINDMMRVDVYVPKELSNKPIYDTTFSLLNLLDPKEHVVADISLYGLKNDFVDTAGHAGTFKDAQNLVYNVAGGPGVVPIYNTIKFNRPTKEINIVSSNGFKFEGNRLELFNKRMQLLKFNLSSSNRGTNTVKFEPGHDVRVWWADLLKIGGEPDDFKPFVYGYSIRKQIADYYPTLKDLPIKTVQSIMTPIVEIIDKYIIQRFNGTLNIKNSNVALMMKGGDTLPNLPNLPEDESKETKGGAFFDIIEPHETVRNEVIPAACEFYISAYHILKFYRKLFEEELKSETDLKFFKLSSIYNLKQIYHAGMKITSDLELTTFIGVLNEFWNSFDDPNPTNKTKKAIELLISEINSCLIYNTSDNMITFKDTIEHMDNIDMFTFNFSILNNIITKTIDVITNSVSTLTPDSVEMVEKLLKTSREKLEKTPENYRLSVLKNIMLSEGKSNESDYMNFCEVCMTPFAITIKYYLTVFSMILNTTLGINTSNSDELNLNIGDQIEDFIQKYFDKSIYIFDDTTAFNGINKPYADELKVGCNFILTLPEVYLANKDSLKNDNNPMKFRDFFKELVTKIYEEYKTDIDQCIHNLMLYPGYSDEKLSQIKTNFHDVFANTYEKALETLKTTDLSVIQEHCKYYTENFNFIPKIDDIAVKDLFSRNLVDQRYSFDSAWFTDFKATPTFTLNAENSYTKFICVVLAKQQHEGYLPQSFIQMLENSPLNGVTFDVISGLGIVNKMNDPKLAMRTIFGTQVTTNFLLYISHSDEAINKTSTNLMSPYYSNSLVAIIPTILELLNRCAMYLDDNFNYYPDGTGGRRSINAKTEITLLSQMLIKLYNEVLPISTNIQYLDVIGMNTHHSLTELFELYQENLVSLINQRSFTYFEWVNPFMATNVGINYDNYDRFKQYKEHYIKEVHDANFSNSFNVIIKQIARLTFNNILLHTQFIKIDRSIVNTASREPLIMMGGKRKKNDVEVAPDKSNKYNRIINSIVTNPRVLALVGHYGLNEDNLRALFTKMFDCSEPSLNNFELSHSLGGDVRDIAGHLVKQTINTANVNESISMAVHNIVTVCNKLQTKNANIVLSELNKLFDVNGINLSNNNINIFDSIKDKLFTEQTGSIQQVIKILSDNTSDLKNLSKFYLTAVVLTIYDTLRYFSVIDRKINTFDHNTYKNLDSFKAPVVLGSEISNTWDDAVDKTSMNVDLSNLLNKNTHYIPAGNIFTNSSLIVNVDLRNYGKLIRDSLNNPKEITHEILHKLIADSPNSDEIIRYIGNLTWNEYSVNLLADLIKRGYDIGYFMFISSMLILSKLDNSSINGDRKIFGKFETQINNYEGFVAAYCSVFSNKAYEEPLIVSQINYDREYRSNTNTVYKNSIFSVYNYSGTKNINDEDKDLIKDHLATNLALNMLQDIYTKGIETDPYKIHGNYYNPTKLTSNVPAGYISKIGVPTLMNFSRYIPNDITGGELEDELYDYYLAARVGVGMNLKFAYDDDFSEKNVAGFNAFHLGNKFNGAKASPKLYTEFGYTGPDTTANYNPDDSVVLRAGRVIKLGEHIAGDDKNYTKCINALNNNNGVNVKSDMRVNSSFMCDVSEPGEYLYKSVTNGNESGNNPDSLLFDTCIYPNIQFVNGTDNLDIKDNNYFKVARTMRELTLYQLGVIYGKNEEKIKEGVREWNTLSSAKLSFDDATPGNNITNIMSAGLDVALNGDGLIDAFTSDNKFNEYYLSATPILGKYRKLVKLSRQQEDFSSLFATNFKIKNNIYTAFIIGRPVNIPVILPPTAPERYKLMYLLSQTIDTKNLITSFLNLPEKDRSYVQQVTAFLQNNYTINGANVQLDGNATYNSISLLMNSLDNPYQFFTNESRQVNSTTQAQVCKDNFIPMHSPFISNFEIVIIKNIETNPELIFGFGPSDNYTTYATNNAPNGIYRPDSKDSTINGTPYNTKNKLIYESLSAFGEINDPTTQSSLDGIKGSLPIINNLNRVDDGCIPSTIVRSVLNYSVEVGREIKQISKLYEPYYTNLIKNIRNNLIGYDEIQEILFNTYAVGMPISSKHLKKFNDWKVISFNNRGLISYMTDTQEERSISLKLIHFFTNNQTNVFIRDVGTDLIPDLYNYTFDPAASNTETTCADIVDDTTKHYGLDGKEGDALKQVGSKAKVIKASSDLAIVKENCLANRTLPDPYYKANYDDTTDSNINSPKYLFVKNLYQNYSIFNEGDYKTTNYSYIKFGNHKLKSGIVSQLVSVLFPTTNSFNENLLYTMQINHYDFLTERYRNKNSYSVMFDDIVTDTESKLSNLLVNVDDIGKVYESYKECDPFFTAGYNYKPTVISESLTEGNLNTIKSYTICDFGHLSNGSGLYKHLNNIDGYGKSENIARLLTNIRYISEIFGLNKTTTFNSEYPYRDAVFNSSINDKLSDGNIEGYDYSFNYERENLTNQVFTIMSSSLFGIDKNQKDYYMNNRPLDNFTSVTDTIMGTPMFGGLTNIGYNGYNYSNIDFSKLGTSSRSSYITGGFKSDLYGNYLTSNITDDLIRSYYYDHTKQRIYGALLPSLNQPTDITNLVISYYRKPLVSFSPLFDKYMFVEILYNSALLNKFINTMLKAFTSTNPGTNELKETLNYLTNMFSIYNNYENYVIKKGFDDDGSRNYNKDVKSREFNTPDNKFKPYDAKYNEYEDYDGTNIGTIAGIGPDFKFTKDQLKTRKYKQIIYENRKLSTSEIGKALVKLNDVYDSVEHTVDPDTKANMKGIQDSIKQITMTLLDLDKYNIFLGTLCKFIKTFGFYNSETKTVIPYTHNEIIDLEPTLTFEH